MHAHRERRAVRELHPIGIGRTHPITAIALQIATLHCMASLAGVVAGRRVRCRTAPRRWPSTTASPSATPRSARRRSGEPTLQRRGEATARRRGRWSRGARFDADATASSTAPSSRICSITQLGAAPTARALDRVMKAAAGGGAGLRPPEVTRAVIDKGSAPSTRRSTASSSASTPSIWPLGGARGARRGCARSRPTSRQLRSLGAPPVCGHRKRRPRWLRRADPDELWRARSSRRARHGLPSSDAPLQEAGGACAPRRGRAAERLRQLALLNREWSLLQPSR